MSLPFALIVELLETRTKDATRAEVVYVEDELYRAYSDGLVGGYRAMEHPEPNLIFRGATVRPMSSKRSCSECGRPL